MLLCLVDVVAVTGSAVQRRTRQRGTSTEMKQLCWFGGSCVVLFVCGCCADVWLVAARRRRRTSCGGTVNVQCCTLLI